MVRICYKCKQEPTIKAAQSMCGNCRKVYVKEHYEKDKEKYRKRRNLARRKRRKWLTEFKRIKGCKNCGTGLPGECYEFNHIKDNKVKGVTKLASYSMKKILIEMEKCELLCRNYHKEITYRDSYKHEPRKTTNHRILAKRKIINKAKSNPCIDCGEKYNYWVMEMDHRRGEKNMRSKL